MSQQRSNSAHRVRADCGSTIFEVPSEELTETEKRTNSPKFAKLLAYNRTTKKFAQIPPIILDPDATKSRLDRMFSNPVLLAVSSLLLFLYYFGFSHLIIL